MNFSWIEDLKRKAKNVNLVLFLLVMLFGAISWMEIMGLYTELPILVHTQPEGWSLPSYLVIMTQCSIVAPIAYTLVNRFVPGDVQWREKVTCYGIITTGCVATLLLIFFWPKTVSVNGAEHSVAWLCLVGFICLKSNLSAVVFFPYMNRFPENYIPAYMAGDGMGGLLPGLLGLVQRAGGFECKNATMLIMNETSDHNYTLHYMEVYRKEPLFSVSVYLIILLGMVIVGAISFIALDNASICRKERVDLHALNTDEHNIEHNEEHAASLLELDTRFTQTTEVSTQLSGTVEENTAWRIHLAYVLNFVAAFFVYSVEPSLRSYACLPYGYHVFDLGVKLKIIITPIAAAAVVLINSRSMVLISAMMGSAIVLVCLHIGIASMSPTPPLQNHIMGPVIVVGHFAAV